MEPLLWVVAGCLFEISLPAAPSGRWRWTNRTSGVTLLAEELRHAQYHFRFRAEADGALAGVVPLRFRSDDGDESEVGVAVKIAPERLSAP